MKKLSRARRADIPAMQDEKATAGKTSSFKLKEPKIGILLPKLSAMPPGAVSKAKSIASSHLTLPARSLSHRASSPPWNG